MASSEWRDRFQAQLGAELRLRKMTGQELAVGLSVSPNTITRWRNASNGSGISAGSLVDLSRFLGMSPAEWFLDSAVSPRVQLKIRWLLHYLEGLDEYQLDRYLALLKSLSTTEAGERLRRVLGYLATHDEDQLDRLFGLVERLLAFVDRPSAKPQEVAEGGPLQGGD